MEETNDIIIPDYIKEYCKTLCKIIIWNKTGTGFFMKSRLKNALKKKLVF